MRKIDSLLIRVKRRSSTLTKPYVGFPKPPFAGLWEQRVFRLSQHQGSTQQNTLGADH